MRSKCMRQELSDQHYNRLYAFASFLHFGFHFIKIFFNGSDYVISFQMILFTYLIGLTADQGKRVLFENSLVSVFYRFSVPIPKIQTQIPITLTMNSAKVAVCKAEADCFEDVNNVIVYPQTYNQNHLINFVFKDAKEYFLQVLCESCEGHFSVNTAEQLVDHVLTSFKTEVINGRHIFQLIFYSCPELQGPPLPT